MRLIIFLPTLLIVSAMIPVTSKAESIVTSTFNSGRPLVPSSQYTPDQPYTAQVYVINDGRRYDSADYNRIWGTPPADAEGNEWFHPDYQLSGEGDVQWQDATAPFSSDEYYRDHMSFRWTTVDITADIYMRRTFTLDAVPEGTVFLSCGHDDAPAEWYINGVLVYSVSDGWNNDETYLLTDEQKALIKGNGETNVIAAHIHQNYGGAFADCGLYEADMAVTTTLLSDVSEGPWPCKYYFLNKTSDIAKAEAAAWYSSDEDESEWAEGVGPFSNDANMFFITGWASQERPILVRRHFTLSADEVGEIADDRSRVILSCSYDENPIVYLNGTRIWSVGGWNDNNYAEYELNAEQKKLLSAGDNVLAVSLTDGAGGGHIDYGLRWSAPYTPPTDGISAPWAEEIIEKPVDNRIFNLQGCYLGTSTEGLANGIYIIGGSKIVICK